MDKVFYNGYSFSVYEIKGKNETCTCGRPAIYKAVDEGSTRLFCESCAENLAFIYAAKSRLQKKEIKEKREGKRKEAGISLEDNGQCFVCGKNNSNGLKLTFYEHDGIYKTRFTPSDTYQGFHGILHGGITSTLLDEIMGRYLCELGILALTVELQVRFKKAIKLGQELLVEGRIVNDKGKIIEMESRVFLEDGYIAATGKGKFIKMKIGGNDE